MPRGIDAKIHGLFLNILISPLEGEKKFLSELYELRNFREWYNLKYICRHSNSDLQLHSEMVQKTKNKDCGTKSAMTGFGEKSIILFSGMLRSCFGRSALLCRQGKNNYNRLVQHKTELERFEPSPAFVMLAGVRKRLLPLAEREGSDSVISNNFSDTVFSRFTSHFSLKRTAFTLAEVLITLGIIGIVASLTLPSLVVNYREKVFVASAKKNYSVLTNAINKWNEDNGAIGDASAFWQSQSTDEALILDLAKYLNVAKVCTNAKIRECGGAYDILQYKKMNDGQGNTVQENWISYRARIVLADGTFVSLEASKIRSTNCEKLLWANEKDQNGNYIEDSSSPSGFKGHYYKSTNCGRLAFDTNGLKGPNQIGVDVFQIPYMGDGQIGTNNDSWGNINYILANDKLIKTEKYKIGKFE